MPVLDGQLFGRRRYVNGALAVMGGWGLVFVDFRVDGFDPLHDALGFLALAHGFGEWRTLHSEARFMQGVSLFLGVAALVEFAAVDPLVGTMLSLFLMAGTLLLLVSHVSVMMDVTALFDVPVFAARLRRHRVWLLLTALALPLVEFWSRTMGGASIALTRIALPIGVLVVVAALVVVALVVWDLHQFRRLLAAPPLGPSGPFPAVS